MTVMHEIQLHMPPVRLHMADETMTHYYNVVNCLIFRHLSHDLHHFIIIASYFSLFKLYVICELRLYNDFHKNQVKFYIIW